jgi:hypothetical protein
MYKDVLIILFFTIPFLFIGYGNQFNNGVDTFVRFLISIFISWEYLFLYRLIIDSVDVYFLCCDNELNDAARVFAIVFWWIPSLLASLLVYIAIKVFSWSLKIMRKIQCTRTISATIAEPISIYTKTSRDMHITWGMCLFVVIYIGLAWYIWLAWSAAPFKYKDKILDTATYMLYVLDFPSSWLLGLVYDKLVVMKFIDPYPYGADGLFFRWMFQRWVPLTIVGYIQWLVLVPRLIRFWRNRNALRRVFIDHLHKRMGTTSVMAFIVSQLKALGERVNRS